MVSEDGRGREGRLAVEIFSRRAFETSPSCSLIVGLVQKRENIRRTHSVVHVIHVDLSPELPSCFRYEEHNAGRLPRRGSPLARAACARQSRPSLARTVRRRPPHHRHCVRRRLRGVARRLPLSTQRRRTGRCRPILQLQQQLTDAIKS